ncbi:MAG: signal peptidase I, partial [Polyangiaceae bacterium]
LPTLATGDVVVVTRRSTTSFGSLVRCTDPDAPGRYVVGRVVGLSHDTVDLVDEQLSVNGRHEASSGQCDPRQVTMKVPATGQDLELRCLRQEFAGTEIEFLYTNDHPEGATHATVEPGKAFLLSDNRHLHLDSRDFGQVGTTTCQHVVYRLWGAEGWSGSAKRRLSFLW